MAPARDPLDGGDQATKAWEEFRVVFSAAFQHLWLLDELKFIAPDYAQTLESRFQTAFYTAELLADEDPDHDGTVPLHDPNDHGIDWYPSEAAGLLYSQLFPHGANEADPITRAYGLALVALHSALETYAEALEISVHRSMPKGVRKYLRERSGKDLDALTADQLSDCDATRHIIVHNRGIVDGEFVNKVKDNQFTLGEYRPLKSTIVHELAQAIWRTAVRLREAAATPP